MKRLEKLVLRLVIYSYVTFFGVSIAPDVYMNVGRNFLFVDSYIADIDTPYYGKETTKAILDDFNSMGNNKAVFYTPNSANSRPIYIKEQETIKGDNSIVGQALPLVSDCVIVIEKGLDAKSYYQVVLHEYLHCMGYSHTWDENDLMYPTISYADIENIKKYAKEIEKRNN